MTDYIQDYQNIPGQVLIEGDLLVELDHEAREGTVGDINEIDDDVGMLRFRVQKADETGYLLELEDSSYCTDMPVDTDVTLRQAGLELIAKEVGEALAEDRSIKSTCGRLSWLGRLVTEGSGPRP